MDLKVFWTQFAINKLEDIFSYYKDKANPNVAKKLVTGIIDATIDLNKAPRKGQREPLLVNQNIEFRYLVYKNYKIIYFINADKYRIDIVNVFDSRQIPTKVNEFEDEANG